MRVHFLRAANCAAGSRCARARTVGVPHGRHKLHLWRAVRKILRELELCFEEASFPAPRSRQPSPVSCKGERLESLSLSHSQEKSLRVSVSDERAASEAGCTAVKPEQSGSCTYNMVPGGPTMRTSQTNRLSSLGPTEMPSGGLLVISAPHSHDDGSTDGLKPRPWHSADDVRWPLRAVHSPQFTWAVMHL